MRKIPQSLLRLTPERFRHRGLAYAQSGRVVLEECNEERVRARVTGNEPYEVLLVRRSPGFEYSCSCPYFKGHVAMCKHVWAALYAAADTLDLETWVGRTRNLRDAVRPATSELGAPVGSRWVASPETPTRTQRPAWAESLARLRAAAQPPTDLPFRWPAERQVVYLLDLTTTRIRGRVRLHCSTRDRNRDGKWAAPKPLRLDAEQVVALPEADDRAILALLNGARSAEPYTYGWGPALLPALYDIDPAFARELLPRLCATGRCRRLATAGDRDPTVATSLRWNAEPWRLRLTLEPLPESEGGSSKENGGWQLQGRLVRANGEQMALSDPLLLLSGSLAFGREWVAPFEDWGCFEWVKLLRERPTLVLPANEADDWLEDLYRLPRLPPIDWPPELELADFRETPRPRLRVSQPQQRRNWSRPAEPLRCTWSFRYGEELVTPDDPRPALLDLPRRRRVLRDTEVEAAAYERLLALGAREPPKYRAEPHQLDLPQKQLPTVVRDLLADGWEVEAEGLRYRAPGKMSLSVKTGVDWFDLAGGVDYDGETVALPALLAALRKGEAAVRLGDGSFGLLPEEWLARNSLLAELGEAKGDKVRFAHGQAALLDGWLADQPEIDYDEAFERVRGELADLSGITAAEPPPEFRGELRDYQRDGLGWLRFLQRFRFGGCLADDMGLGKTVQILAVLAGRRSSGAAEKPSLVVVPRSLIFNWREEAARFAPGLRVLEHVGPGRPRTVEAFAEYDLVLTTYGTLRGDLELLGAVAFDYCVLDEAQAIKNEKTAAAKAARRLRADHRLVATGTPVENHLGELWSLFEFLNPGLLGRSSLFRGASGGARKLSEETRQLLARALRPFLLRRTKQQVASELPEKTEQTLFCTLEGGQRRLYDELRHHYRQRLTAKIEKQGLGKSKLQVLEALLRLRQAACHPALLDGDRGPEESAKFEALLPLLTELREEGHKALVFSQFTSLLALLRARLDADNVVYEYLDGATTDRQARVERFQTDPDCPLFLISLKAGGFGLNLTAAEYVFLLDPWWNPAVEAQAIDRTHRIGQSRPVFAYRLIARDTVEEHILELQATKRALADAILGGEGAPLAELSKEDLDLLLS